MAADKGDSRSGPVRTEHACRPSGRPCRRHPSLLRTAPPRPGPRGRNRGLEVHRTHAEIRPRTTYLRSWNLGRNLSRRIHAAARRSGCARTLVLQWFREHRPGSPAEEAWYPQVDRDWPKGEYLHRLDGALCRRTRIRRHPGEGCDRQLPMGRDAGDIGNQSPNYATAILSAADTIAAVEPITV